MTVFLSIMARAFISSAEIVSVAGESTIDIRGTRSYQNNHTDLGCETTVYARMYDWPR